ncbi:MAG: S8 family serine peptidase [Bdellovibrionales bacterium]
MKKTRIFRLLCAVAVVAAFFICAATAAIADDRDGFRSRIMRAHPPDEQGIGGLELLPESSLPHHDGRQWLGHTHLRVLAPADGNDTPTSQQDAVRNRAKWQDRAASGGNNAESTFNPSNNPNQNTPASLACIYGLVAQPASQPPGCDPRYTSVNVTGGFGAIAIVVAYDNPTAAADLAAFSRYFGLPQANFQVVYAGGPAPFITGPRPPSGVANGWAPEASLDIEWAHAFAPSARIYLVEAQNESMNAMITAVIAAQNLVYRAGGGQVSMSWGVNEFSNEAAWDYYFSPSFVSQNVQFVATAGDNNEKVSYPAVSPYVISVGGTTILRNTAGRFTSESTWSDGGGGLSRYLARPSFQGSAAVQRLVGARRGTPDISFVANPNTGVAFYAQGRWRTAGGTSIGAPAMAGILNNAASRRGFLFSPAQQLSLMYARLGNGAYFRDISSGTCGADRAAAGYDLCTGLGTPLTFSW